MTKLDCAIRMPYLAVYSLKFYNQGLSVAALKAIIDDAI